MAGQTVTLSQAAGCAYSLSATSVSAPTTGGTFPINVLSGGGCPWTVVNTNSWITATPSGSGNGAVTLTLAANTGADRSGTLTIAGVTVSVNQSGVVVAGDTLAGDHRAGSVLIFNYYNSSISSSNQQNTQISLTNTHDSRAATVRLYFVDSLTGTAESYDLCLAPNQTYNLLTSEFDPSVAGYVMAVAVDSTTGCPVNFNYLEGQEAIKLNSGHNAILRAIGIPSVAASPTACTTENIAATLNFDGMSYAKLPKTLTITNLSSIRDGNDTLLVINRIGGSFVGGDRLGTITGNLYNFDHPAENFSVNIATIQLVRSLSNSFPRIGPLSYDQMIPNGRIGWMYFGTNAPNQAIVGAVINQNPNIWRSSGAFSGGYNLPMKEGGTASAVSLTIMTSAPNCQ